MKKYMVLITLYVLIICMMSSPASAYKIGDTVGYALTTDIVASINGYHIPSYNIEGYTYVVVEDLRYYGFSVRYDGITRSLNVSRDYSQQYASKDYTKPYVSTSEVGNREHTLLYTDIKTYLDGIYVHSHNINGQTIMRFDALVAYGAVTYDNRIREISLELPNFNHKPEIVVEERGRKPSEVNAVMEKECFWDDSNGERHTYKLYKVEDGLTWREANEWCKESGGHLFTITSEDERNVVKNKFYTLPDMEVWCGMLTYDDDLGGGGEWITGEEYDNSVIEWSINETPYAAIYMSIDRSVYNDSEEVFVTMNWHKNNKLEYFIAEYDNVKSNDIYDNAWKLKDERRAWFYSGHVYELCLEDVSWEEAKVACERKGGHLAVITGVSEIKPIALEVDGSAFWLGGYKEDGVWKWITGEAFSYQNWYPGQPDGTEASGLKLQIYGLINNFDKLTTWDDIKDDGSKSPGVTEKGYICEWECADDIVY